MNGSAAYAVVRSDGSATCSPRLRSEHQGGAGCLSRILNVDGGVKELEYRDLQGVSPDVFHSCLPPSHLSSLSLTKEPSSSLLLGGLQSSSFLFCFVSFLHGTVTSNQVCCHRISRHVRLPAITAPP